MEILENFAVFEGCDGSGTTTQLDILENFFKQKTSTLPPLYKTFEPTDGFIGKLIRSALRMETPMKAETIALLFAADRNEHLYGAAGIAERCARGELVISDRYVPSSLVYQGLSCGDELPGSLNIGFPGPELLIYLDIDIETAQKRMESRKIKEIYENLAFQVQVRERYSKILPLFAQQGVRVEIIDASPPPHEVSGEIWRVLQKMPIFKR